MSTPLPVGGNNLKARIKTALNFKKPIPWIIISTVFVVGILLCVFLTNPNKQKQSNVDKSSLALNVKSLAVENNKVEQYLSEIMSSPKTASSPYDYINAHQNEYQSILKMGDKALQYLFSQFRKGGNNNLRGHIMMSLCKDLLNIGNSATDIDPQAWFDTLVSSPDETILPNYVYIGTDPLEKLVYDAELARNAKSYHGGFLVIGCKVLGSYEQDGKLKIIEVTTSGRYKLNGNKLSLEESSGGIPAAITFSKQQDGSYTVEKFEETQDGSRLEKSIRNFCTMPVTNEPIPGLAEIAIGYSSKYDDIKSIEKTNLANHLKSNNLVDAVLYSPDGRIDFSLKDYK